MLHKIAQHDTLTPNRNSQANVPLLSNKKWCSVFFDYDMEALITQ